MLWSRWLSLLLYVTEDFLLIFASVCGFCVCSPFNCTSLHVIEVFLLMCGSAWRYRVATSSRILKMISLFCRISSLLQGSFAKETCNFKEPTNRSHPIAEVVDCSHTLWRDVLYSNHLEHMSVLHGATVCCSVLQCVAVCCRALQCAAVLSSCTRLRVAHALHSIQHFVFVLLDFTSCLQPSRPCASKYSQTVSYTDFLQSQFAADIWRTFGSVAILLSKFSSDLTFEILPRGCACRRAPTTQSWAPAAKVSVLYVYTYLSFRSPTAQVCVSTVWLHLCCVSKHMHMHIT